MSKQPRWPFVWLFIGQLGIVYGFVMVMVKSPDTALGLIFLTFVVPPMVVNLWLRLRTHRTRLDEHVATVDTWRNKDDELPAVDVFLPSCGEPIDVLDNTFAHVSALAWSGPLQVHVLDDAHLPAVRELAEAYGFQYLARANRGEWKKAGNLINAFDSTDGDFIVVFDADFVPRPDFLYETMPYMDDPYVGVVQTAQYFDVVHPEVNYIARYAGALQELFFRWIQPARDTYEAAICAGTNVVYRRAAVVAAGGFAKVPLGEDVHSGVKIWVANFRTRYIPLVLARGLAPDTWEALTNQQYRWCRSSMLLMVSQFFRDAPFTRRQRICFWAAFLYYMASAALLVTSALPTILMLWLFPDQFHWWNYFAMVPAFLSTFLIFPKLARGWDIRIYRVTTINSCCHALACIDALRQKVQAWVPTGATNQTAVRSTGKANTPRRVAILLRTWLVVVQTLLWTGIARDIGDWSNAPVFLPAIALGLLQLYMLAPYLWRLNPSVGPEPDEAPILDIEPIRSEVSV